jgi:lysophospholipase L1-like esterase
MLHSRRWRLALLGAVAVVVVAGAELGARALAPYLDEPLVWGDRATQVKAAQIDARGCADVVVVGNSMARDGIQPTVLGDELGVEAYNAALDAAGPTLVDRWLSDEVVPGLDPTTVVLAVSSIDLNGGSAAAAAAAESYDSSIMGRDDLVGRLGAWATEHSDLVRYRTELRQPTVVWDALGRARRDEPAEHTSVAGIPGIIGPDGEGLSRRTLTFTGESVSAAFARDQLLNDFSIGSAQVQSTRELLTDLDDDGIDVVVVILPVTDEYVELHPHGADDVEAFLGAIDDVATDTGVRVVDLHDASYDHDLFADTHHLTAAGGERLSPELADALGDVEAGCAR